MFSPLNTQERGGKLGEDWYIVSDEWFSEFTNSINLTNPQQNDSLEFPERIPIKTSLTSMGGADIDNSKLLHSDAWDMLFAFNGMSHNSMSIKRMPYRNEGKYGIDIPIYPTRHRGIIGHNSDQCKFSIDCDIETFPYET